ncbi:hypothetical protein LTR37_013660 [Vermiconidia calcicola]|uniref:Uncharacterized protein n=1 Tax=Vermiconidia calcicola TaxID=1690605 RepID=A0ACC3MVM7_9PEZI|nr:hypothetical protein LTR37_013660 [Vermiconidia calcicola]
MRASPALTAVAARPTLQRPPPPSAPPKPQKVDWSSDVRQYVQRAFDPAADVPGISTEAKQEMLKRVITRAAESGEINQINWNTYPLPQHLLKQERDQNALHGAQTAVLANTNTSTPTAMDSPPSPRLNTNKRKSPDTDLTEAEQHDMTPPWKKKTGKNGVEHRITGKSKTQEKKQKKAEAMRANAIDFDPEILEKRRQRFEQATADASPYNPARDETPPAPTGPLPGTCQKLEKNYFRLTAPPPPETVRPLHILQQAVDLILKKWKKEHDYSYACDQLKSLRQDLTVQHIKNDFTVKVYEVHARIALEMADLGEYNQCQTQLRALYKLNLGGKPEEFVAYRILYFIYTCNRTDMNDVLADLTPADKQKPGVQHALQVRSALASGNYHKFFRLYDEAPFMGPYLLDMFIQRERFAALAAICKAYKPDVSLQFLAKELAFHGDDVSGSPVPEAGRRQCLDFLCQHGAEHLVDRKDDDVRFLAGKAGPLFENLRAASFRRVDIKGQI